MLTEEFKTKFELFLIGCDAIEELNQWDKVKYGEMDIFYQNDLMSVILRLIASDGIIDEKEVAYFNDNFGFVYTVEELQEVYKLSRDEVSHSFDEQFENGITIMRSINKKLADAYKELLCLICDIIIESDGIISPAEVEEVKMLKELF